MNFWFVLCFVSIAVILEVVESIPKYKVGHFEQLVDHFNFEESASFQQRYLFSEIYWDGKGPIFFYSGNEGSILGFWENSGFVFEAAQKFNALVIFGEHRYYGTSLPFGQDSFKHGNIGYLSIEQALADFAVLLTQLKKDFNATDKAVVSFGGSYGGMLSAYLRFKYPNIVRAALAASAPIYMLADTTTRDFFFPAVTKDFQDADKTCPGNVVQGFIEIENLKKQGEKGLPVISEAFKLCKPLTSVDQINHLIGWIRNAFTIMAMCDYPYPTSFLAPLPANPVNYACKVISGSSNKMEGLAEAAGLAYNGTGGKLKCFDPWIEFVECADPTGCGTGNDNLAWDYQACTEFLLPSGTNNVTDMFPELPWTLDMRNEYCNKTWNVKPRLQWTGTSLWGKNISSASNIIFSNGDLDPWRPGGVLESVSSSLVAILIKGGAHHLDLRPSNPNDPPDVTAAREQELALIRKWIS
ncbi:dipeptidyl peptidase 2-like [Actinia tenebrosa]|uniref:Dipeptidyl peptidase 2-like n=1 Tax=Actinia tenebrosa TaxID=6105 RepID=A0A6P8ILP8_ACTTE|nr:dipeptidyl peptidase 2-like [Actinia tenebrosa]